MGAEGDSATVRPRGHFSLGRSVLFRLAREGRTADLCELSLLLSVVFFSVLESSLVAPTLSCGVIYVRVLR